jgi:N utilization substance protein A
VPGDNLDLLGAIRELERERGIDGETLLQAVEAALVSAYKRNYNTVENVAARINRSTGRVEMFVIKRVVDEVLDPTQEIAFDEAQRIDPAYQSGDVVEFPVVLKDFGRIAAQTAKQVLVQRIREAERGMIYDEFAQREGDIVTGVVQRTQNRNVFVDLGKTEAVLPPPEQMPGDTYTGGERLKLYLMEVRRTTKGPQVIVSRTHPGLLKRLFELEVPEIHSGVVEIKAIAREAGTRSKMAVFSRDDNVDPVGACVGHKGMRVQQVVNELHGERVDIVKWAPGPAEFVANALSPSKVTQVLLQEEEKVARVVVPDHQLSLAIGRAGQNARLAAKLTGWRIDIRSESQLTEDERRAVEALPPLGGRAAPWQVVGDRSLPPPAPWAAGAATTPPWAAAADGDAAAPAFPAGDGGDAQSGVRAAAEAEVEPGRRWPDEE